MLGLLKRVSRSFYVSLRLLPAPMREGAAMAYLLARTTDTIADSSSSKPGLRLESLEEFIMQVSGQKTRQSWPEELVLGVEDLWERELLTLSHRVVERARELPGEQLSLVQEVMDTIVSGQILDLNLFGAASKEAPVAIASEDDLDDYTYRVAGCVGEFWTKLGLVTLGDDFSVHDPSTLMRLGANYGKGLQLVNILRDLPGDLAEGRCYLPLVDPGDRDELMSQHRSHCRRARVLVQDGLEYAAQLRGKRVRVASALPALLAEDTLDLLDGASWSRLEAGIKISRRQVYADLLQALCF